jgi:hypothetical protein
VHSAPRPLDPRKPLRELQVGWPVELELALPGPYADRQDADAVAAVRTLNAHSRAESAAVLLSYFDFVRTSLWGA